MKTAMILAAGRGERLKPLTGTVPKAMCLVHGIPLIEHHVINLVKAGFTRLVINHAYLGDQIRRHLGNGQRWGVENLSYSAEPPGGLETGGGIVQALPLLGEQPFLTVNADIYTDYAFDTLTLPPESLVHLLLGNNPAHNAGGDFGLHGTQLSNQDRRYTFLGVAMYHPRVFASCRPGRYPVTPILRALAETHQASASHYDGLWVDIGTMDRLRLANTMAHMDGL